LKKGFTDAQAKLKAVWENPNIATICSEMPNMTILMSNVAAAYNRTKLSTRKPVQIIAQVVLTFASRPAEATFPLAM
jgi:hypothetical protein